MKGRTFLLFSLTSATYFCCIAAYTRECENATVADIVFLVDNSKSPSDFGKIRSFLNKTVAAFNIGPEHIQVGLVQYSDEPFQEFTLNYHKKKKPLQTALLRLSHRKGGTQTGKAIDFVRTRYFTSASGSQARKRPQIAIVITDGESTDEVKGPAQRLRAHGVIVFAIGVGQINQKELESIVNKPPDYYLTTIDSYDKLKTKVEDLLQTVCVSVEEQNYVLGEKFADIFFLVDSGIASAQLTQFKTQLGKLINQLNVGASSYRVGLAEYSTDTKVEFFLNAFQSKEEFQSAVKRFQPRTTQPDVQRLLGKALEYAKTQFFSREMGGRAEQAYRQFLVVVSSKASNDPVSESARRLTMEGVTVIGMSAGAPEDAMYLLSDKYAFKELDLTVLNDLIVTKKKEEISQECKSANLADIVFIVDESASIAKENFRLVRDFLRSVVSSLDVSETKVRVGIVTYAQSPKVRVHLNTMNDKTEILNYISTMPYAAGRYTYTGKALNFTCDKVFQEKDSRKGVKRMAVVITDGKSHDNVSEPALSLQRSNVTVFTVGIANANQDELIAMATFPADESVFFVKSYTQLKAQAEKLQRTMCKTIIDQVIKTDTDCKIKNADIFFLIDDSGSITHNDFNDMIQFIIRFLKPFSIGSEHVRIGLVKYADSPSLEFDLGQHKDVNALESAVKQIQHSGGGTKTGDALSEVGRLFRRDARSGVPKYLIVITDGQSTDDVKNPAEELRSQDIIVYAIGVIGSDQTQLDEISGGSRTFMVNNYDALKFIHKKIITEICSPEVCAPGDVIFLVDSSESINKENFEKTKNFMKSVIKKIVVKENNVHVGLMQYSNNQKMEFNLGLDTIDTMLNAIDDMVWLHEGTYTGKAISQVSHHFSATYGGRPGLQQMLVVITDGMSSDNVKDPAEELRKKGVVIYALGVDTNNTQLLEIAGSRDRVYSGRTFNALKDWENRLTLEVCSRACSTDEADVIFLVDASETNKNLRQFKSMLTFMDSIEKLSAVSKNQIHFGVILYSNDAKSVLTLDKYNPKQGILNTTPLTPRRGYANTGNALEYSLQFFSAEHGGRAANKVPQILMVITDSISPNDSDLRRASAALEKSGVIVLSIGVKNADLAQLTIMANDIESRAFKADNYDTLQSHTKDVFFVFCPLTKPVYEGPCNLVFLLDRSSSITRDDHKLILHYSSELVKSFNENSVHFGAVQFSSNPEMEFELNRYQRMEDVIEHISKLSYTGGDTNIGKALNFTQKVFPKSAANPQSLVLFSDGSSLDDVEEAASYVRDMGTDIFAFYLGDISLLQLLQITGTPENLFAVNNFNDIRPQAISAMCKPVVSTGNCSIDIAIAFDISQRSGVFNDYKLKLQASLPKILQYMSTVGDLCCLKQKIVKTRIAFQLVNQEGHFEEYNEDTLTKVMAQFTEPTYFNSALLDSFRSMFNDKSKANVKVVVIFSDGLDEDVMDLHKASEQLKESNVNALLTVALEGAHDPNQLQSVAFGLGYYYNRRFSVTMVNIGNALYNLISAVSKTACCNIMCVCVGNEGLGGSRGLPGPKGMPGEKGVTGFTGDEGIPGSRGPPGPEGAQGITGCQGPRGVKGDRGVSGEKGEIGVNGVPGTDGIQGLSGQNGTKGERGHPGNPGMPGVKGDPGSKGQKGLRGDPGELGTDNTVPGPKGEPGAEGLPGLTGPDGEPGDDGVTGHPGLDGKRGRSGEKGRPGPAGDKGAKGNPGAPGPQGRAGNKGAPGPKGLPGFPGHQGAYGKLGEPGRGGRRGANGQKGQPGDPGIKGGPGSKGARGVPGQDGNDGHGPSGSKGVKGDLGFPGYPGLPGLGGDKGTKGHVGHKGNDGQWGLPGKPGPPGTPGLIGFKGHSGKPGPPGESKSKCQLIAYIRDNCACCNDSQCPAFPTELVFGLDMSQGVRDESDFKRQRDALLSLLEDISIAESNCPTGARVAVVAYSSYVKYLIRFQDYRRKSKLIELVKNIPLERTSNTRELGAAMRFVGHNVFKRTRAGTLMRKVAVFFSHGPSQNPEDIETAVMEYRGSNIIPAIISLSNAPKDRAAMKIDDTGNSIFASLDYAWRVKNCAICYDPCRRTEDCSFIQQPVLPQEVDVDLVMVADSSRQIQADEYTGIQQLFGSVLEQLAVSRQQQSGKRVKVAIVQQNISPKLEYNLQLYQNRQVMKKLIHNMEQQGGSSALGHTLEISLDMLLKTRQPRRKKVLLTVVGTQTAYEDRAKLHNMIRKVKCNGVAVFVVTVGERYNQTEVSELASQPLEQHLIHAGRLNADEQGYAQRYFRVFLSTLQEEKNRYPPLSCQQGTGGQEITFSGGQIEYVEEEIFQEQAGVKTQTGQLDVIETLIRGDGQSLASGVNDDPNIVLTPQLSSFALKDSCFLKQDPGTCQNYSMMWFFDSEQSECSRFWYGGCGGNNNRFKTQDECESLCLTKSR